MQVKQTTPPRGNALPASKTTDKKVAGTTAAKLKTAAVVKKAVVSK